MGRKSKSRFNFWTKVRIGWPTLLFCLVPCLAWLVGPQSEAEEQQTGAVHSSASACWGQLTHAGIKTDTATVEAVPETRLSPPRGSPVLHARSQISWHGSTVNSGTCSTVELPTRESGHSRTKSDERRAERAIAESVSHGPVALLSWPHVLTVSVDLKCYLHGVHRLFCHTGMD